MPLAAKVEQQKKILWITTAVSTAVFKDKNLQYVFRAQIHSDQYGQAFAGFLTEHAKAKLGMDPKDVKVALIHEDGPYGVGVAAADEAYCKEAGLQVVMKEGYSASAPDLGILVTKLKRARADVISHAGYNPDITLFLRQARENGLKFKMMFGNGAGYSQLDKLRETFGADIDNFCNIDPVPAQLLDASKLAPGIGDLTKTMVERYKQKTNATDVPPHCSMGFNQTWILLNNVLPVAKDKYGGFDPEAIRKAALDVDIPAGGTIQGYGVKFFKPGTPLVRSERTFDAGRDAECRRAYFGGVADQYPDAGPGVPAAEIVGVCVVAYSTGASPSGRRRGVLSRAVPRAMKSSSHTLVASTGTRVDCRVSSSCRLAGDKTPLAALRQDRKKNIALPGLKKNSQSACVDVHQLDGAREPFTAFHTRSTSMSHACWSRGRPCRRRHIGRGQSRLRERRHRRNMRARRLRSTLKIARQQSSDSSSEPPAPAERAGDHSQRDSAPLFGGPIAGVVDLDGLEGQREIGQRLPPRRDAFHEVLDLLQVAARPFLLEADILPAGLAIDLFGDVDARRVFPLMSGSSSCACSA